MRALSSEFYGDDTRWFIGVCEQHEGDPLDLGRIKVRVFGLHSGNEVDISVNDLPWSPVVVPVTQPGTAGLAQPFGIQAGARVYGIFLDGKLSQQPLILGSIPSETSYSQEFLGGYGDGSGNFVGSSSRDYSGTKMSTLNLGPGSNAEKIFDWLSAELGSRGSRYAGEQAAGLVGNFIHEAGAALNPDTNEGKPLIPGSRGGYGLAQWTGPRRRDLEAYAAANGGGLGTLKLQLNFTMQELSTRSGPSGLASYMTNSTVEEAAETIFRYYETPYTVVQYNKLQRPKTYRGANRNSSAVERAYFSELESRQADARNVYDTYYRGGGLPSNSVGV